MSDFLRESFSYSKIFKEIKKIEKRINPEKVAYGEDKNQYYFYYEPGKLLSDYEVTDELKLCLFKAINPAMYTTCSIFINIVFILGCNRKQIYFPEFVIPR